MEQSFADLLRDAFSEASVPSFPDGDLDFQNLNCDESPEKDGALHQEAAAVLSLMETIDDKDQSDDKNGEEDFQSEGVMSMDETLEEDYTGSVGYSEQKGSVSGDDEEDEDEDMGTVATPGDLLMSVCYGDELCSSNKEDRLFAEGQALAPEGAENPQGRDEEQGESESDEEVSYFERVPEGGSEMMTKGDRIEEEEEEQEREEEKQEDLSDSECEVMKVVHEENVLARHFEQVVECPCGDGPEKASLEFPEISAQNLQDLIAEDDSEEYVEKVKEFSGEEHQEAGESFADYPSDFSSYEYIKDGGIPEESESNTLAGASANSGSIAKQDLCPERVVVDIMWTGRAEDTDEEGDECLYSRNLEVDAGQFRSLDVARGEKDKGIIEIVEYEFDDAAVTGCDEGETGESESYSSSDDEELDMGTYVDDMCPQDGENSWARWSSSDSYNRADPADLNINWNPDVLTTDTLLSEDLLTTEHTHEAETLLSDLAPAEDVNSYSMEAKTISSSNQRSLDDSFFFNTELEASGATEVGQLGDEEDQEERNWVQEQQRIEAFYQFYDDSGGGDQREGRQIKVQFCTNPLSQVIRYETDSSDRDSLSSSTDLEEDLSSAETSEELKEPDDATQMTPFCDPPLTQTPENKPNLSNMPLSARKDKCLNMLKLTLKMCAVITMGLLMFWWSF